MKTADDLAMLLAIRHGVDVAIHTNKDDLLKVADEVGVKTFTTKFGQVTIARTDGGWQVRLNDDDFLAWCVVNAPTEVEEYAPPPVTRVNPSYRAKMMKDLLPLASGVLNKDTGELVTFAEAVWQDPGDPYITYPASTQQKAAKAAAESFIADRVQSLADGLITAAIEGGE